jgi:GAF domain-containing protein
MPDRHDGLLEQVAALAADLGPALAPVGHLELLRSITAAARELFDAAACSLALLDEAQETLTFHVATGAGAEEVVGQRVPVDRGIAGWVVSSGQPVAVADVARDPRFAADVAAATGYVPRSVLAMPLQTERAVLGVIELLDQRADAPAGRRDMELLGLFAQQAALAIEASRVFGGLGQALFQAVGLAAADRARDPDRGQERDLVRALDDLAGRAPGPAAELAELAGVFAELGRAGPGERTAATRLVREFLAYVRGGRSRP